ncbi:MAG: DUF4332 domain-containing protein [Chloroflexi bacterium]|nr:DUF4332 domain-containing protein [Chloroflexota bacterium]
MAKIADIKGIGSAKAVKFAAAGVKSVAGLLAAGATAKGRKELAAKSGYAESSILEWVNRADLARIKGVGEQYADLLEATGVDSVIELGKRNAVNLHEALAKVNAKKKRVKQLPAASRVAEWVKQAKSLKRIVQH